MTDRQDRIRGSMFGLAYGDALAAKAEFLDTAAILARWPGGPRDLEGDPALVTDDTQMAVAVGDALTNAWPDGPTVEGVQAALAGTFANWFHSSDNTRAPGLTCLSAAARLSQGFPWDECTVIHSKGCGANMRVAPVAFLGIERRDTAGRTVDGAPLTLSCLAQMQAAMTHGHPTALAAADLTAHAIRYLIDGGSPGELVDMLREHADAQKLTYHNAWLGGLWMQMHGADSGTGFISQGWNECARSLDRLAAAAGNSDHFTDPCDQTGSGWIAEEALSTAVLCFLLFPDDPVGALNRASVTRGDSDSIAAITGALAGAHLGFGAWPSTWFERIEGASALSKLAETLPTLRA